MARQPTLTVQLMHANARIAQLEEQLKQDAVLRWGVVAGKYEGDGERNTKYANCFATQAEAEDAAIEYGAGYHFVEVYPFIQRSAAAQPQAPAPKTIAPRTLPAHFAAAREAAMRLGKCVRVAQS